MWVLFYSNPPNQKDGISFTKGHREVRSGIFPHLFCDVLWSVLWCADILEPSWIRVAYPDTAYYTGIGKTISGDREQSSHLLDRNPVPIYWIRVVYPDPTYCTGIGNNFRGLGIQLHLLDNKVQRPGTMSKLLDPSCLPGSSLLYRNWENNFWGPGVWFSFTGSRLPTRIRHNIQSWAELGVWIRGSVTESWHKPRSQLWLAAADVCLIRARTGESWSVVLSEVLT